VDPRAWAQVSSFFANTTVKEFTSPEPKELGEPWSGVLHEVVGSQIYDLENDLEVDYVVTPLQALTRYNLTNVAQNPKMAKNDGWFQVRRDPDHPGWCKAFVRKCVRWKSGRDHSAILQAWTAPGLVEWFDQQVDDFLEATPPRPPPAGGAQSPFA